MDTDNGPTGNIIAYLPPDERYIVLKKDVEKG